MLIAQRNIDIGLFYIILCEQMKYLGTDNKILTPYTTPHIIGGVIVESEANSHENAE